MRYLFLERFVTRTFLFRVNLKMFNGNYRFYNENVLCLASWSLKPMIEIPSSSRKKTKFLLLLNKIKLVCLCYTSSGHLEITPLQIFLFICDLPYIAFFFILPQGWIQSCLYPTLDTPAKVTDPTLPYYLNHRRDTFIPFPTTYIRKSTHLTRRKFQLCPLNPFSVSVTVRLQSHPYLRIIC